MTGVPDSSAVHVEGLVVEAAGRPLLQVAHLDIRPGERVALIGPNGAGKSTLLRALGGFTAAARGQLCVLGRRFGPDARPTLDRRAWRDLHAGIGQVFQGLHLVPRLTARENVILGALARPGAMPLWRSWARLYPETLRDEADALLAALGLADRAHVRADRLSGGERQKVGIARLQMQRPRLVLADEPTAALDPGATAIACATLRSAAAAATLIVVVHDASLLPHLADRVIGLADGRVAFDLPRVQVDADRLERLYASASRADVGVAASDNPSAASARSWPGGSVTPQLARPAF